MLKLTSDIFLKNYFKGFSDLKLIYKMPQLGNAQVFYTLNEGNYKH